MKCKSCHNAQKPRHRVWAFCYEILHKLYSHIVYVYFKWEEMRAILGPKIANVIFQDSFNKKVKNVRREIIAVIIYTIKK